MSKLMTLPRALAFIILVGVLMLGFSHPATAHGWKAPADAAQKINPVKKDQASVERGKAIFLGQCANCHGSQAMGDGPLAKVLKPSPSNLVQRLKNHPEGDFFWKISFGRNQMPAFKDTLSETDIWDTINFIHGL